MQSNETQPNGYYTTIDADNNVMKLSTGSSSSSKSITIQNNKWYRIRFIWKTSGELIFELYDEKADNNPSRLRSVTENDNSYKSGGIAFKPYGVNSDGQKVYYDSMVKGSI